MQETEEEELTDGYDEEPCIRSVQKTESEEKHRAENGCINFDDLPVLNPHKRATQ